MQVPYEALSEEALQRLVESYITREGYEFASMMNEPLALHAARVKESLRTGEAVITFDELSQSINIIKANPKR